MNLRFADRRDGADPALLARPAQGAPADRRRLARRWSSSTTSHPTEKLRIYDKGYDRPPEFTQYGEYLTVRHGDIHIPRVDMAEPLDLECRHFLECIAEGRTPRTGARHGLAVVRVLDAAHRSLKAGGAPNRPLASSAENDPLNRVHPR